MKELPRSLSREGLFSTSSVSQGRGEGITLFCREALRESSNLGLEGFGRVTAAEKGNLNSLLLTKNFMLSSCTLHRQSLQQLPGGKPAVGIPVEEHFTLDLLLGACASSAAQGLQFPLSTSPASAVCAQ